MLVLTGDPSILGGQRALEAARRLLQVSHECRGTLPLRFFDISLATHSPPALFCLPVCLAWPRCCRKKDLCSEAWVMEARRRCGFDGPDFKDRFASSKKKAVAPLPDSSFSDMAVDEANGGSPVSHHYHQHHQQQDPSPPMSPDDPHPDDVPLKREEELSETALLIRRAHEVRPFVRRLTTTLLLSQQQQVAEDQVPSGSEPLDLVISWALVVES